MGLDHGFFPESQLDVGTSTFVSVLLEKKKEKKKGNNLFCNACFVAGASQQRFGVETVMKWQKDKETSRGLFRMLSCLWLLPTRGVVA